MPDLGEMKNKAGQTAQDMQDMQDQDEMQQDQLDEQQDESTGDQARGSKMDDAKKKMDVTGDGKVDMDDVKKMGEDAVNKVKGMFKKD